MKFFNFWVLAFVFFLTSCTVETPFSVVEKWLSSVENRDWAELEKVMVNENLDMLSDVESDLLVTEAFAGCESLTEYSVSNFDRLRDPELNKYGVEEGNVVFYTLNCQNGMQVSKKVDIVKVDGEWKVSNRVY